MRTFLPQFSTLGVHLTLQLEDLQELIIWLGYGLANYGLLMKDTCSRERLLLEREVMLGVLCGSIWTEMGIFPVTDSKEMSWWLTTLEFMKKGAELVLFFWDTKPRLRFDTELLPIPVCLLAQKEYPALIMDWTERRSRQLEPIKWLKVNGIISPWSTTRKKENFCTT